MVLKPRHTFSFDPKNSRVFYSRDVVVNELRCGLKKEKDDMTENQYVMELEQWVYKSGQDDICPRLPARALSHEVVDLDIYNPFLGPESYELVALQQRGIQL